jgi:PAS domain S-box-containing protein
MRQFGDAIFDAVAEGIVIVGRDGGIVRANRCAEEIFGYGRGVLEGQVLEVLLPDRLRARHAEHRAGFFAAPRRRRMGMGLELASRRANGDEFPIEVSLSFVRTDEGEFDLAFVTDITERRALEQTARQTEKFAALATLSAGTAHELNNPLSIISSRLELMLSEPDSPQLLSPQLAEDLQVVHRNVQRVSQIAQSLRATSRGGPSRPCGADSREQTSRLDVTLAHAAGPRQERWSTLHGPSGIGAQPWSTLPHRDHPRAALWPGCRA